MGAKKEGDSRFHVKRLGGVLSRLRDAGLAVVGELTREGVGVKETVDDDRRRLSTRSDAAKSSL